MNPIDTIKQEYSRVKTKPFKHDGKPVKSLLSSCVNPCYGFHVLKDLHLSINANIGNHMGMHFSFEDIQRRAMGQPLHRNTRRDAS